MDVSIAGERTRIWRLPDEGFELDMQLLIADGHHRYETAVAFREEHPEATHTFAVFVSSRSPGLEIFPTHRMANRLGVEPFEIMTSTWDKGSLTHYFKGNFYRVDSDDELDVREVESYEPHGITTTATPSRRSTGSTCSSSSTRSSSGRRPSPRSSTSPAGRDDAAEVDIFLSQARLRAAAISAVNPWLERSRAAVADVKAVLAAMPTRAERERPIGRGEGGDITVALDKAAEEAVLAHFELDDVRVISEEIGMRGAGAITVLIDPIDGSQNAERGVPYFALSIAVAEGDTIADVVFGYVYDFGANEEWMAVRGGQEHFWIGRPLTEVPKATIELLSIEATRASVVADRLPHLVPFVDRVRIMGAQAITFCHLAAGRTDAVVCLPSPRARLILPLRSC